MNSSEDPAVSATSPKIYADIMVVILDFVDDKASLAACSLVGREWLDASQRRLLHSLDISKGWCFHAFLRDLQTTSLRVRSMPRKLHIVQRGSNWDPFWVITCAEIIRVMESLPEIHELALQGIFLDITADLGTLSSIPLKVLRLDRVWLARASQPEQVLTIGDILHFIALFHGIEELAIHTPNLPMATLSDLPSSPLPSFLSQQPMLSLRALYLSGSRLDGPLLRYLRVVGAANTLHKVQLRVMDFHNLDHNGGPFRALQELLAANPSVLESLDIEIPGYVRSTHSQVAPIWAMNPSSLTSLRYLSLHFRDHVLSRQQYGDIFCWQFLLACVAHFSAAPIQELNIELILYHDEDVEEDMPALHMLNWKPLDESFCRYTQLRDVRLNIGWDPCDTGDVSVRQECMDGILRSLLPRSREKEALCLTCRWDYEDDQGTRRHVTHSVSG